MDLQLEYPTDPILWVWKNVVKKGGEDKPSVTQIRQQVLDHIVESLHQLMIKSGQLTPPYDPSVIAPQRSVAEIVREPMQRVSMLLPKQDGFTILLRQNLSHTQSRFAVAHELVHTFFYDTSQSPPSRPVTSSNDIWKEEDLCNQVARDVLMPKVDVLNFPFRYPTASLEALKKISRTYDTSFDVAIRQIQGVGVWNGIFLILDELIANGKKERICVLIAKLGDHDRFSTGLRVKRPLPTESPLNSVLTGSTDQEIRYEKLDLALGSVPGPIELSWMKYGIETVRFLCLIQSKKPRRPRKNLQLVLSNSTKN